MTLARQLGRAFPKVAGLIATMPLTTLIVMLWLYSDRPGDLVQMRDYTVAVLYGIAPSVQFFVVAYVCFRRGVRVPVTLCAGLEEWLVGAGLHLWLLHGFRPRA
jgi:uncharacterized membrane protein (GlpM family)